MRDQELGEPLGRAGQALRGVQRRRQLDVCVFDDRGEKAVHWGVNK